MRWVALAAGLLLASSALAQPPGDLSGLWQFETSLTLLGGEVAPCTYQGTADILQSGNQLSGNAMMALVNGGAPCPSEGSAAVSGSVNGSAIMLQLDGGNLGVADLGGQYMGGFDYAGLLSVETGPLPSSGTWSAGRISGPSIPALGVVGATMLTLLLTSVALVALRARSHT